MANMSYCRFENTSSDLEECVDALESTNPVEYFEDKTNYERRAFLELLDLANRFVDEFQHYEDDIRQLIKNKK